MAFSTPVVTQNQILQPAPLLEASFGTSTEVKTSPGHVEAPVARASRDLCSCVKYARSHGVEVPIGTDADELSPNSPPIVGGLALFRYPKAYHVAVVTEIQGDAVVVKEANYTRCKESIRTIPLNDSRLRGFWMPV